ncbi:major facilitator superfamily domain-containing protein [Usnea florida]
MASKAKSLLSVVANELGIFSIAYSSKDTKLLCLQRFTRLFAYGASTLILALYLSSVGTSDARIGLFMTLTLLGDVVISFLLTLVADGLGRRRILMLGAALMSASGVVFALSGNYWVLVAASIFGVISPSGNEIGPFRAIEESTLAQLTAKEIRSDIFAWYTLVGNAGTASGSLACGWIVQTLLGKGKWSESSAYRMIFGIYAVLGLVKLLLAVLLSDKCEPEPPEQEYQEAHQMDNVEVEGLLSDDEASQEDQIQPNVRAPRPEIKRRSIWPVISPASRSILIKLCLLFAVDSLASGLVPLSWVTYFFNRRFKIPEGQLGTLFFATNIISSISNLAASSLAKRIGLIKTMVFTHLPSAIFLALIPLPSQAGLAVTFLILRSCMQNMDQAPRQAFLSAAVLPSERTAIMGVVNVVKTLAQSGGPIATGWLAEIGKFWIAFLIAGAMKASYDLAMLKMFLGQKSREEEEESSKQHRERENGAA